LSHVTFSKIDHNIGYKASIKKYKKIDITSCILSDHNATKLELKTKNNNRKYTNNWRLNIAQQSVGNRRNKGVNRKSLEFNDSKKNLSEPMGHSKGSPKRKVYSHKCMY
jgi:hypothetical protein